MHRHTLVHICAPGADECAHDDWAGPNQEPGIDYGFLTIIDNEAQREDGKYVFGGFHGGQLVDGVISGAVKNGSMTILLQIEGLDDPQGTVVDGVLTAGPIDLLFPIDIIGVPTTDNGNAANFTIEQFDAAIAELADGDCPLSACTSELGGVLSDGSESARNALGDCIASCISDETGLSTACTGCYGSIAACSTAFCIEPCLPPNSGSEECANCALENCIDVNACTGLY